MNERRFLPYLLILPSLVVLTVLYLAPIAYFLVVSFWQVENYRIAHDFTLDNYREVAGEYLPIALLTLRLAAITAACTTLLGFAYAYIARFKAGRWGPLLLFAALITLFGGYLMKIYAWKTILGVEGIINTAFLELGLISEPITALLYNPATVVVTLANFLLPLAILPIFAALRGVEEIELEVARDLGAGFWRVLADIVVPRCRTGLVTAFAFCFLIACGDWVTPILVGGKMTMIGNLIAHQFGEFFDWPLGAAMSFSVLVAGGLVLVASSALMQLWRPR
jgi:spermidine/putrescine transport system permease protein